MRWCIFYVDGAKFSNEDGAPEDAPGSGVAAIAQEDSTVGVYIHHQRDLYAFDEQYGGWYGLDAFGFAQYLTRPGLKIVKLAEVMTTESYKQLIADLRADPGLPEKSARYEWERPL